MNKPLTMEFQGRFEADVARVLRALPNVAVTMAPRAREQPDVLIHVGDRETEVFIEAKRHVNAAAARQLAHHAIERALPVIVVAETTTADAREVLAEHGVGLIDGLGNARLELPGLLVHVTAPRTKQPPAARPTRLSGKAGVVAQAMLLNKHATWHVQDLADTANVSPALAHRVLARLDTENLTEITGAGPNRTRRLTDAAALLDLWAEEMHDQRIASHPMFRLARSTERLLDDTATALHEAHIEHAATGAGAATRVAPFIAAVPVIDIWITETADPTEAAAAIGAELVTTGHNLLLRQAASDAALVFRRERDGLSIVNPFRLYYDLRQDPRRGREQAVRLREELAL